MTEIMPVPRNLILLSYQQGASWGCFFYYSVVILIVRSKMQLLALI